MKARVMIIGLAAIAALLIFAWPRPDRTESRPVRSPDERVLHREATALRDQRARHERSRDQLQMRLSELEGRLNEVERAEPAAPAAEAEPETATARNDVGEGEIATWMDRELELGSDEVATREAASQLQATIAQAQLGAMRVEQVSCGQRFCRASLYQESGERPTLQDLYGAPPLTGEGFTMEEPDGRLGVYFARNGERIADFRDEALLASAP